MFQTVQIAGAYNRNASEKAFDMVMQVLLGLYFWEWINSLDFDWQYISRKKPFLWPLTFYFMNRYFMLISILGIAVGVGLTSKMNCQAIYDWNVFLGASAIGLASVNLSLRTMAVWSRPWYIVTPLIVLILGHFGLLLHALTIGAKWFPGKGCVTISANVPVLMATLYNTSTPGTNSRLRNLIFRDGLIYFIIVFLMNLIATIVISLHRDPAISIITSPPSAVMSTIVAGRVVRRLNNYSLGSSTHPSVIIPQKKFQISDNNKTFRTLTVTHVTAPLAFRPRPNNVSTMDRVFIDSEIYLREAQTNETRSMAKFAEGGNPESQAIHRRSTIPLSP